VQNTIITNVEVPIRYNYFKRTDQTYDFLVGQRIHKITRKAKYQLFYLDKGILLTHNKFTGLWECPSRPWTYDYVEYERKALNEKDVRCRIHFANGEQLWFHDSRTLGMLEFFYTHDPTQLDLLTRQGPDVLHTDTLDPAFNDYTWEQADFEDELRRSNQAIKAFLLDQTRQAGIGNLYVCEALWESQIDPRTPAKYCVQWAAQIMVAVRLRMTQSIGSAIDYMNVLKVFKVRNRPMICPRCKHDVERMVQQNRGTYWCSGCQTKGRKYVPIPIASLIPDPVRPPQNAAEALVVALGAA